MFTVPQLSAVPCPRSKSLSSTRSLTFHRHSEGLGRFFQARVASCELNATSGSDSALPDLLDPAHPVLVGVSLQAGGLIAKNQTNVCSSLTKYTVGKVVHKSFEIRSSLVGNG
jgi:hypothetical protein